MFGDARAGSRSRRPGRQIAHTGAKPRASPDGRSSARRSMRPGDSQPPTCRRSSARTRAAADLSRKWPCGSRQHGDRRPAVPRRPGHRRDHAGLRRIGQPRDGTHLQPADGTRSKEIGNRGHRAFRCRSRRHRRRFRQALLLGMGFIFADRRRVSWPYSSCSSAPAVEGGADRDHSGNRLALDVRGRFHGTEQHLCGRSIGVAGMADNVRKPLLLGRGARWRPCR